MSSRLVALRAFGLALLFSERLSAQAGREADSLWQRVRVLDSAMSARGRTVDSLRRAIVRPLPPVDIRQGPLHVRTDSILAPKVRGAVDSVVKLIARRGGTAIASRVATYVPTITRDSTRSVLGMLPVVAIRADTARRWSMIAQRHVRGSTVGDLADGLAALVEQLAIQGVDSALAAWVMLGRAPLRRASTTETADSYIELATTESAALRRCRARDVDSCLDALGIDSMPGSRLARWYAPEDYRSVIRGIAPSRDDSAAVAAWFRCRRDRVAEDCNIAAHALPNDRVPLPLSASMRFAFLREVLDAGGTAAFDRLITSGGSMKDRFAAAAGEPLGTTVVRWLDHVEASKPNRMTVPASLVAASLGWSFILALAVIRRNPWA
jgi:hypothetical protein